jgi:hypothetical protein
MGDPINFELSRYPACDIASGDNETIQGEPIQGEINVGQANTCQAGGWLPRVQLDRPYGACTLQAVAAPNDGSVRVCELEYSPLPPVCIADDEAAAAEAAKARAVGRGETLNCPDTGDMTPCPGEWNGSVPVGWKEYPGISSVFHCSFRGMVADCDPDSDHLQQECFYNKAGQLVDDKDIDYRCAGSPNADDASKHPIKHVFSEGGIIQAGWGGFVGTVWHADRRLPKFPPR